VTLWLCSGQDFAKAEGKTMTQHVSSDKRKDKALAAWGDAESIEGVKAAFGTMLSDGAPFPWADAGISKEMAALSDKLQAMAQAGMLAINALPAVRCADTAVTLQ
jgi:hypothetical protein